jgi:hypothetical protein
MMMTLLAYIYKHTLKERRIIRKCFDKNEEKFECGNKRILQNFLCHTKPATAILKNR